MGDGALLTGIGLGHWRDGGLCILSLCLSSLHFPLPPSPLPPSPGRFIAVEQIKPSLVANNAQTYWVPEYVKDKRFHNWLENARDWAVSRSRFWGTPLPIWASPDFSEVRVVGSVQELKELSGELVRGKRGGKGGGKRREEQMVRAG